MFFKRKKKSPPKVAESVKNIEVLPYHQQFRRLEIAGPDDFGSLHEEIYDGEFCKTPWVRVSFSLPSVDWNEFQTTSHFESLVQFLSELHKQSRQSQNSSQED